MHKDALIYVGLFLLFLALLVISPEIGRSQERQFEIISVTASIKCMTPQDARQLFVDNKYVEVIRGTTFGQKNQVSIWMSPQNELSVTESYVYDGTPLMCVHTSAENVRRMVDSVPRKK